MECKVLIQSILYKLRAANGEHVVYGKYCEPAGCVTRVLEMLDNVVEPSH